MVGATILQDQEGSSDISQKHAFASQRGGFPTLPIASLSVYLTRATMILPRDILQFNPCVNGESGKSQGKSLGPLRAKTLPRL